MMRSLDVSDDQRINRSFTAHTTLAKANDSLHNQDALRSKVRAAVSFSIFEYSQPAHHLTVRHARFHVWGDVPALAPTATTTRAIKKKKEQRDGAQQTRQVSRYRSSGSGFAVKTCGAVLPT